MGVIRRIILNLDLLGIIECELVRGWRERVWLIRRASRHRAVSSLVTLVLRTTTIGSAVY